MKNYLKDGAVFLYLCLPILIYMAMMGAYDASIRTIVKETVFNGAVLMLLLAAVFNINNRIVKGVFSAFLLFFYIILFIQIMVFYNFYNFIDNAILYTAFETNSNEIIGFIDSYGKWYQPVFVIFYLYIAGKILFSYRFSIIKYKIATVVLCIACLAVGYKFIERSISLLTIATYSEYQEFTSQLSKNITNKTSSYFTNAINKEEQALYVVIVGESTSLRNMGIYGYYRDTNPELSKMKDELYLFNDVISPRTHTILSLDRIFSLGDYKKPEHNELGTVFQLANQAGFKTYWVSNQEPLGVNETLVSLYARATSEQHFVTNTEQNSRKLDDALLPVLDRVIQDSLTSKKIIFLHLKGTHIFYRNGYPPSFEYFEDEPRTKFPSGEAFQTINEYDNAVRYNDYIVSRIIQRVKKQNTNSYVIYFSDHGDDVYQDYNGFGHYEGIGTNAMYQIPFIVWLSDEYKQHSGIDFNGKLERKYILEDFIYSFAELSRIEFDQFQPQKSIFSNQFIYKERLISPGVNYDERN